MTATLKVTHKALGAEVRRHPYDIVIDGQSSGSVKMNETMAMSIAPGHHTLQVRDGRKSSAAQEFDAAESETITFRCTGKRLLPIFIASFAIPSLALKLKRE